MKKQYLFGVTIIFCILCICMISAEGSVEYNPGDLINITETKCLEVNDSNCDNTTVCYLTVINDSKDFLVSNVTMDVIANAFRSYDLGYGPNYTTTWSAVMNCQNGGVEEFIINIGETISNWENSLTIGLIGLIFIYALMGFLVFAKEHWLVKTLLFMCSLFFLLILVNSSKIITVGEETNTIMQTAVMISIVTISVMFLYVFIFITIQTIVALKEKRGVKWQ